MHLEARARHGRWSLLLVIPALVHIGCTDGRSHEGQDGGVDAEIDADADGGGADAGEDGGETDAGADRDGADGSGDSADCGGSPLCSLPATLEHDESPLTTPGGGPLHPDGFIGDPTVVFEDGRYRMWFTSSRQDLSCSGPWYECLVQGIAYAESTNGQLFDDRWLVPDQDGERTRLVFEPDPAGWDRRGLETASVLRGPDGKLWMYYTGHMELPQPDVPFLDAIGLARSDDGIVWTRHADQPVFQATADWERVCCDADCDCAWGGVLEPSVLFDESSGQYHLWYVGFGERDSIATYRIGHAVSSDGLDWQRDPDPVLDLGEPEGWDGYWTSHVDVVSDPCSGFHLFYQGGGAWSESICEADPAGCTGFTPGAIGYAFSPDGIFWQKAGNPLLEPEPGRWDGFFVGGPDALFVDGVLHLFYFGNRDLAHANAFDSEMGHVALECG